MRETIDKVVMCSEKPLSIIILGLGNGDFSNMEVLDADDFELIDSFGKPASRDIVQFVKYDKYKEDLSLLAAQVLCEVPEQLVSFMVANKIPVANPNTKSNTAAAEADGAKKKKKKQQLQATPDKND